MNSENSSAPPPLNIEKCSLVLLDVAGTTTSINFVTDILFPLVVQKSEDFLKSNWDNEEIKECINLMKGDETDFDLAKAVEKVKTLTEERSDNKGLKTLQGLIYKEYYENGELKAHIFDDVQEAFELWSKTRRIAIYSTGSVDSQKQLFTHTIKGDISTYIHKYFDQSVGPKTEPESYKNIAKDCEVALEEVVFITDDPKEAAAAKSGQLTAVLVTREGNADIPEDVAEEYVVIGSFKDLNLDKTSKRKIEEESSAVEEAPPSKVAKTDGEDVEDSKQNEDKKTEESMDVDVSTEEEKQTEDSSEETKTALEEKTEPEKTEIKNDDTEMEEMKTTEPVTAEEKVEENTTREETKVEEKTNKEETETVVTPEANKDQKSKLVDEKESKDVENETTETQEAKTEQMSSGVTKKEEKESSKDEEAKQPDTEKTTTNKEDTKIEDVTEVEESAATEKILEDTKTAEEEEETPVENGEKADSSKKVNEKEKNVLANGVENGKEEIEVENSAAEGTEAKSDEEENEVKIKKLEESAESKTVSVEV